MAKKPLGPNSPPAPRRGENKSGHDLTILKNELEHEKRLRETILWSNGELERIVYELEDEIYEFDTADPNLADPGNEWWVRLEGQKNINEQLEQQRKWLELELEHAKQRHQAKPVNSDAMNFDLDLLSETELIRLIKRLERQRTDLHTTLRNLEWRLDKEGREFHRLTEMKNMHLSEAHHYAQTYDRLKQTHRTTITQKSQNHATTKSSDKLPPLDVVQAPVNARWGNSSQTKRNFNPDKGPVRRANAGVRTLPKIPDKRAKVTTPRGKVDKRTRRIKSGGKEKKKEDVKVAETNNGISNAESATENSNQTQEPVPDPIVEPRGTLAEKIAELAQAPLQIIESENNIVDNELAEKVDDNLVEEQTTEVANEMEKETNELVEKTEDIQIVDEIECN